MKAFSFCEGDLLTEMQRVDSEWFWARLERSGRSGLAAVQLTVPLVSSIIYYSKQFFVSWFVVKISLSPFRCFS